MKQSINKLPAAEKPIITKPVINQLFDESLFQSAKENFLIDLSKQNTIYYDYKYGTKDIDELVGRPVRLMLCALGKREWRTTMLWRNVLMEGTFFNTAYPLTLADMSTSELWEVAYFYDYLPDWYNTVWAKEIMNELNHRQMLDDSEEDRVVNHVRQARDICKV